MRPAHLALLASAALAACQGPGEGGGEAAACNAGFTPIARIQGEEFQSPLAGEVHDVLGIATHATPEGLYIESAQADASDATSEGLFLADPRLAETTPGSLIAARGTVAEIGEARDTLTALTALEHFTTCGQAALPLTAAALPLATARREPVEAMRLEFRQPLVATDVYRLAEGQLVASADTMLATPTEVARPGDDARELGRENRYRSLYVALPAAPERAFPAGTRLTGVFGVLGNAGRGPLLLAAAMPEVDPPRLDAPPAPEAADLRLMALNLHNFFNGDGAGGGFPTARGAQTPAEYAGQRRRIAAIVRAVSPHLLAVTELENDGFGELSAAADLATDLAATTGRAWRAAMPPGERIGTDAITTGILYRPDRLQPIGPARVRDGAPFDRLQRPPLAQQFATADGAAFWVVVNHFKSKGSCPEEGRDADLGDGQGCWNQLRLLGAHALADWVTTLDGPGREHVLLLGDFNTYRMEDPVRVLLQAGYHDLTVPAGGAQQYSFVYQGEAGTFDHVFATPAIARWLWRASILHVNAAWPPGMELPQEWLGSSDHDPVLVDLRPRR